MLNKDDKLMNDGDNHSQQKQTKTNPPNSKTGSDGKPNIPGPNELPDQQKVGENVDDGEGHVHT